jgi:hypothetical protein
MQQHSREFPFKTRWFDRFEAVDLKIAARQGLLAATIRHGDIGLSLAAFRSDPRAANARIKFMAAR